MEMIPLKNKVLRFLNIRLRGRRPTPIQMRPLTANDCVLLDQQTRSEGRVFALMSFADTFNERNRIRNALKPFGTFLIPGYIRARIARYSEGQDCSQVARDLGISRFALLNCRNYRNIQVSDERLETVVPDYRHTVHLRKCGRSWGSTAPYGYRFREGKVVEHSKEQAAIAHILLLRQEGNSYREIARVMNRTTMKSRGKKWHPATIGRVLNANM